MLMLYKNYSYYIFAKFSYFTSFFFSIFSSYIDVPALNAPLEPPPADRTKNYGSQIEAALTKQHCTEKTSLLEDIPQVEKTLSDEPLSVGTREMASHTYLLFFFF